MCVMQGGRWQMILVLMVLGKPAQTQPPSCREAPSDHLTGAHNAAVLQLPRRALVGAQTCSRVLACKQAGFHTSASELQPFVQMRSRLACRCCERSSVSRLQQASPPAQQCAVWLLQVSQG